VKPLPVKALDAASKPTGTIVSAFLKAAREALKDEPRANGILLRGFDSLPKIPPLSERFRLRPVCIATYPMYRGLARLVGMEMPAAPPSLADFPAVVRANREGRDFFFVHVKYTDKAGEDGDFNRKREVIEEVDRLIPDLLADGFEVVAVTADHSTPVALKAHSWHPVPALVWAPGRVFRDSVATFSETTCSGGSLGRMPLRFLMAEALAAAGKLAKFGA
jgi:2,3-bisphosphoglycerate-independent phosphoglycerate mutase